MPGPNAVAEPASEPAAADDAPAPLPRVRALWIAAIPLLVGPTVLAFRSGGFFAKDQAVAAGVAFVLLALAALAAPPPLVPRGAARIALAALVALAAWTAASIAWARILGAAADDADRVILYCVCFALALCVMRLRAVREAAPEVLLAGILVVALYALAGRFLPDLIHQFHEQRAGGRIDQPLTYWNAVAILNVLGMLLAIGVAVGERRPPLYRAAACAAAVPCGLVLYLTYSRGAWLALAVGIGVWILLRPRLVTALAALLPLSAVALLAVALLGFPVVRTLEGAESERTREGVVVALLLIVAIGLVALAFHRLARRRLAQRPLPIRGRPAAILAGAAVPVAIAASAVVTFNAERAESLPPSTGRLATTQTNRGSYWEVALRAFADHPVAGVGAGSFRVEWRRERTSPEHVADAHSLYLETLAELGLVGGAILAALIAALALGIARAVRARPGDAVVVATAAVAAAWAVHAGLDWDWEMPAVTLPVLILAAGALQRPPDEPGARAATG